MLPKFPNKRVLNTFLYLQRSQIVLYYSDLYKTYMGPDQHGEKYLRHDVDWLLDNGYVERTLNKQHCVFEFRARDDISVTKVDPS